jgi:hypothetical protein
MRVTLTFGPLFSNSCTTMSMYCDRSYIKNHMIASSIVDHVTSFEYVRCVPTLADPVKRSTGFLHTVSLRLSEELYQRALHTDSHLARAADIKLPHHQYPIGVVKH